MARYLKLYLLVAMGAVAAFGQFPTSFPSSGGGGLTPAVFSAPPSHNSACSASPQPTGCVYLFGGASAAGVCAGTGSAYAVCADNGTSFVATSASSSGGTGNAASEVTTTFSGTPTFTCGSASAGTVTSFKLSTSLTANITSSTLATCTTGQHLAFTFTEDGTGGRTVAMPTGFDACPLNTAANATSNCSYYVGAAATHLVGFSQALQTVNNLSDLASASTARTNLGLGTAAVDNIGTSGATLCLLNANCTFSGTVGGITATMVGLGSVTNNAQIVLSPGSQQTGTENISGAGTFGNTVVPNNLNGTLGTAAIVNTGTSGATIPILNAGNTYGALQTFGTNISIGGVTATGATGTGNVMFSASPTITGTATVAGITSGAGTVNLSASTHTLPAVSGLTASKPATCTTGEEYFATDATAGQNMFYCTATNTWTQQLTSGGSITIAGTSVALGGSTSSFPSPGPIGGTTPNTGAFTVLSTGTSPPASAWFTGTGGLDGYGAGTCAGTVPSGAGFFCNSTGNIPLWMTSASSSIQFVLTGGDINTSNQVTVTHLASALSVNQGGSGTTSTLTGLIRGNSSAFTAAELSGDVITSGSNAATVARVNGVQYPVGASLYDSIPIQTATTTVGYYQINGGSSCGDSSHGLSYNQTSHLFGCQSITGTAAAGGSNTQIQFNSSNALAGISGWTTNGTTTISNGATSVLDLSSATGTAAFKLPQTTTNTATAAGVLDYDTSNSNYHGYNGADSIFGIFPTASVPATGHMVSITIASNKVTLSDGGAIGTAAAVNTGTSGATIPLLNGTLTFSGSNAYGTPSSITLTNATGTASGLTAGLATSIAGGAGNDVPYQTAAGTTAFSSNFQYLPASTGLTLAPATASGTSGYGFNFQPPTGATTNYTGYMGQPIGSFDVYDQAALLAGVAVSNLNPATNNLNSAFVAVTESNNTSPSASTIAGVHGQATSTNSSGTFSLVVGGLFEADGANTSTGNSTYSVGVEGDCAIQLAGGTIPVCTGGLFSSQNNASGQTVTNLVGVNILANTNSGTVTNNIGLLIGNQGSVGANNYAILTGTGQVVFGGAETVQTGSLTLGSSGTLVPLVLNNATSGSVTLEPATGAITSYTIQLPVAQPSGSNTYMSCTAASPAVCTWAAGGTGTVTTVGFTGGLISVGSPTTAPALTVAGTSGGIVGFTSSSAWASSAAWAAGGIGYGLGAGSVPVATAAGTAKQIVLSGGAGAPTMIDFPERYMVPAGNCNNTTAGAGWSIPSGETLICPVGSNNLGGEIVITDTSSTFAQFQLAIPGDWDTATDPYILMAFESVTDTTNGHTVIPQIRVSCPTATNGTVTNDHAFAAAHSLTTVTFGASAVAHGFYTTSIQMNSTDMSGCVAGGDMIVQVGRATDTATGNIGFAYADVTFPRLLVVGAQ